MFRITSYENKQILTHMLKKHVENTIPNWKTPTYIYIYIYIFHENKKTSTHILQLNEVPG